MSIKLSQEIPEIIPDGSNPQAMTSFLVAIKQSMDEIARKAQSLQMEVRTTVPGVNDLEEGEFVRAEVGGLLYTYTKINGVIHWMAVT